MNEGSNPSVPINSFLLRKKLLYTTKDVSPPAKRRFAHGKNGKNRG